MRSVSKIGADKEVRKEYVGKAKDQVNGAYVKRLRFFIAEKRIIVCFG